MTLPRGPLLRFGLGLSPAPCAALGALRFGIADLLFSAVEEAGDRNVDFEYRSRPRDGNIAISDLASLPLDMKVAVLSIVHGRLRCARLARRVGHFFYL